MEETLMKQIVWQSVPVTAVAVVTLFMWARMWMAQTAVSLAANHSRKQ